MQRGFFKFVFAAALAAATGLGGVSCNRARAPKPVPGASADRKAADPMKQLEKDLCKSETAARLMQGGALTEYTARLNHAQYPAQATLEEYIAEAKSISASSPAAPQEKYDACEAAIKPMACAAVYEQIANISQRMVEEQKALFTDVSEGYMKDLDLPEAVTAKQAADAGRAMGISDCAAVSVNASRSGGETLSAAFYAGSIKGRLQIFYMRPDSGM